MMVYSILRQYHFFDGEDGLKLNIKRDNIKNQYIEENDVKLLRIKYTDYDRVEEIISEVL